MVEAYKIPNPELLQELETDMNLSLDLEHTARKLKTVVFEILNAYPEEGFCFLNEGALKKKISFLQDNFLPDSKAAKIAYAVKANPKKRILENATQAGITDFDCASPGEIESVLRVNPGANILYNNPVKFKRQIKEASRMGVTHFTAQTQVGVERILENVVPYDSESPLEIAVRMQTLNEDAEINLSTKFGASPEAVRKMVEFLANETNTKPGVAVNTGSQNKDPDTFKKSINQIANIIKDVREVVIINLGGGFPVNYHESESFDLKRYFEVINHAIKEVLGGVLADESGQIIIEPGRSIVAESVDLFIPIMERENRNGEECVYIDDGVFTSFSDSAIHNWKYAFKAFSLKGKKFTTDHSNSFTLHGRTCDSGDKITKVALPSNIDEGDYLWIPSAGAYLDSQTTRFNGFEPHRYVYYNF